MPHPEKACVIHLETPKVSGGRVRLDGHLEIPGERDWHIYFDFTCPDPSQASIRARPFVLAFLPLAMRLGLPLRCDHPVDETTRDNLCAWQTAYAAWLPLRLQKVDLHAPIANELPPPRGAGALTAFSGGVDSCFTASRLSGQSNVANSGPRLSAGLLIHGFDITTNDAVGFARAAEGTRELLSHYGLQSHELRTNIRGRNPGPSLCWERETYGIWLAACLACLEPWYESMVIPSSFSRGWAIAPCGSSFLTDHLLGSGTCPFLHDGEAYHKPAKIRALASDRFVTDRLRVCYRHEALGGNCGQCSKCLGTMVALDLAGCSDPGAFPVRYRVEDIAAAKLYSRTVGQAAIYYIQYLRDEAQRLGRLSLAQACETAIRRYEKDARRDALLKAVRNWINRLLGGAK